MFKNKTQKRVTRTFRISTELEAILKKEGERQGISVNQLVNKILKRYACFDRLARSSNFITLTKHAFREILEGVSLEYISQAGKKTGEKDIKDVLDMLGLPLNYDSFDYLVAKHYGGPDCAMWFNCYQNLRKKNILLHLQHDLGREWSVYLNEYFLSFLKTLRIDCETEVYDYAVNIMVPLQKPIIS